MRCLSKRKSLINKSFGRSMEVKLPFRKLGQANQPTGRQTERPGHREVLTSNNERVEFRVCNFNKYKYWLLALYCLPKLCFQRLYKKRQRTMFDLKSTTLFIPYQIKSIQSRQRHIILKTI